MFRPASRQTFMALLRKDLLHEPVSRRLGLFYPVMVCGALLWAFLSPATGWFLDPGVPGVAAGPALLLIFSIVNPFLISTVVFVGIIQKEKNQGSFVLFRVLPIEPGHLVWVRSILCFALSMFPTVAGYVIFMILRALGWVVHDPLGDFLLSAPCLLFLVALASTVAILAVGLAMNLNGQQLSFFASIAGIGLVTFPFIFSRAMAGMDSKAIFLRAVRAFGTLPGVSLGLLMAGLLLGTVFAGLFRIRKSYV